MKNAQNAISAYLPSRTANRPPSFPKKGKRRWHTFLTAILLAFFCQMDAQNNFCGYDEIIGNMMVNDPLFNEQKVINENIIYQMMYGNQQGVGSGPYVIPVVFHVIHKGEAVGIGSNVAQSVLEDALDDLNHHFGGAGGQGYDTEIQFCLAQRTPEGDPSTGINREDGTGVGGYESIGIAVGSNEAAVKALSVWPYDYLNIWIVHQIQSPPNSTILGYAYPPGASPDVDGIVMDYNGLGGTVLIHEAGHFFDLYHTFEEGDANTCPPLSPCETTGDRICDTDPTKLEYGCDEFGTNICPDPDKPKADIIYNYMGYSSCQHEFTPEQATRMKCVINDLRPELLNSLGCEPSCPSVTANFDPPPAPYEFGDELVFGNTSTGSGLTYEWMVNGSVVSTDEDLTYEFNQVGSIRVCLTATDGSCTNRKCQNIEILPQGCPQGNLPNCEYLLNGDFSVNSIPEGETGTALSFGEVCNWLPKRGTPFLCSETGSDHMALWGGSSLPGAREGVVTIDEMPLIDGESYLVSFEYYVVQTTDYSSQSPNPSFQIGLSHSNGTGSQSGDFILESYNNLSFDELNGTNENCLDDPSVGFHPISFCFEYSSSMGKHLFFEVGWSYSVIYLSQVSVQGCGACPGSCYTNSNFTETLTGCTLELVADDPTAANEYIWNFGDGSPIVTGPTAEHTYIFGGTFNVCLTASCGPETNSTMCKQIEVDASCDDCTQLEVTYPVAVCDPVDGSGSTYFTEIIFQAKDGFDACQPGNLYVNSPDVPIVVISYEIETTPGPTDKFTIAAIINAPNGFPAGGASGHILLCNDAGDMACYSFNLVEEACDNCYDGINSYAVCNPTLSNPPDLFVYEGVAIISGLPTGATPFEEWSTETGFQVSYAPSGNDWIVNYSITTENKNLNNVAALLSFQSNGTHCIPLDIELIPCISDPPPTNCSEVWAPKDMDCTSEQNGWKVFNITSGPGNGMFCYQSDPYYLCDGELTGTIEGGGFVEVVWADWFNGCIRFDINIIMPPTFTSGAEYDLRLNVCTSEGVVDCFLIPYNLNCPGGGVGGGSGLMAPPNNWQQTAEVFYSFSPNPVSDRLNVRIGNYDHETGYEMVVHNHFGRTVQMKQMDAPETILETGSLPPGIYFVSILENGVSAHVERIAVVR